MKNIEQFKNRQYLNLETFRRNGEGVKTPVWFAQDGETLHIWTQADSGKVKRIRRDGKVRIVPSTASGEAVGDWVDASAVVLDMPGETERTFAMLKQKYGFMFNVFGFMGKMRGAKYVTIRAEPG